MPQQSLRTLLTLFFAAFLLGLLPASPAAAQFNANADPAYWLLRLQNKPAHWPGPFPVRLEVSSNAVCQDDATTCAATISSFNVQAAVNSGAAQWNDAIFANGLIPDPVITDFFVGCSGATCTLPTYVPYVPDPTLGDQPGNLLNSSPDNRTCVFPAYHVVNPGIDDSFDTYVKYDCSVPGDCDSAGQPVKASAVQPVATAAAAAQLCTLYVEHTIEDRLGGTGQPCPSVEPCDGVNDTFVPVRDANGILQITGDGRNRYYVEQFDFNDATAGLTGGNDAILALTITRGLVFSNRSEITEADIVINAEFGGSTVDFWTLNGATVTPPNGCSVPGEHTDGSDDLDASSRHLCYRGDTVFGTAPGPFVFDLENVTTHELGHLIGLDHPCTRYAGTPTETQCTNAAESPDPTTKISSTTMFRFSNEGQTNKRTIEAPDVEGLRAFFATGGGGGGGCEMVRGGASAGNPIGAALAFLPLLALFGLHRRRRKGARRGGLPIALLAFCAAGLLAAGPARASTVRIVSTGSLVRSSRAIAQVRVSGSRAVALGNGGILTLYQVVVEDSIAGNFPAEIAVPGGVMGGRFVHVAGATHFTKGDELILFARPSKGGRYFVTGLFQGARPIVRSGKGGAPEVLTGAPVAGSLVQVGAGGAVRESRAVGAAELPARMPLEKYKDYLRALAGQ